MIKKLIFWLVRKELGLEKGQRFTFVNQKSEATYWIDDKGVWKIYTSDRGVHIKLSNVGINWLVNSKSRLVKR